VLEYKGCYQYICQSAQVTKESTLLYSILF